RMLSRVEGHLGAAMSALPIGLSALMPGLSGHAAGAGSLAGPAVAADLLHILGAGLWLGGLSVLVVAALRITTENGLRDAAVRGWIEPFHRVAMISVVTVVVTGFFATWLHASSPSVLLRTGWGVVLLTK